MIAVLIAIVSTRGILISATLAAGEKSCRRAVCFSVVSARASRLRSQLPVPLGEGFSGCVLECVSTTNATQGLTKAKRKVLLRCYQRGDPVCLCGVPCSPIRAHGSLPAKMRQGRPTFKKISTYN